MLQCTPAPGPVLAERGPLDFLAYLSAMQSLGRAIVDSELIERGYELTAAAMHSVDLLVILPLNRRDAISIGESEDLELRDAMDIALLEYADDSDLIGNATVTEIAGDRDRRLLLLERAVREHRDASVAS